MLYNAKCQLLFYVDILCIATFNHILGVGSYCCACFGEGMGTMQIGDYICYGSEYKIKNCRHYDIIKDDHRQDWSVYCDAG